MSKKAKLIKFFVDDFTNGHKYGKRQLKPGTLVRVERVTNDKELRDGSISIGSLSLRPVELPDMSETVRLVKELGTDVRGLIAENQRLRRELASRPLYNQGYGR